MTDNEILTNEILCIKRRASGKCNGGTDCNTCDLIMNETEIIKTYQKAMKQNDLINIQNAEIERLNIELQSMRSAANSYKMHYETAKSEAYKECLAKVKNYIKTHCNPYGKPDFDYDTSIKILNFIDDLQKQRKEDEKNV